MNARRGIPLAVVVVVALVGALGWRTWRRAQVVNTHVPPVAPVKSCPERLVSPPPVLAELSQAPLLINSPGVTVKLDGREANGLVAAGVRELEATAPGARTAKFQMRFEAMQPVIIDARVVDGVVSVLIIGARCSSCAVADTDLDLSFRTNAFGSWSDVANALATGDWLKAVVAVRAIPPGDRQTPEALRLLAILQSMAGRQSVAESLVAKQEPLVEKRAAMLKDLAPRQLETEVARWNATTERFQRLTDAFGADAPDQVSALTWTFDGFSTRFLQAHGTKDVIAAEVALQSASKALDDAIREIRALEPDDCEWQRRVVATF
ncbi:MAG: hypothetical protein ACO1OB_23150 [Archangium sp.]